MKYKKTLTIITSILLISEQIYAQLPHKCVEALVEADYQNINIASSPLFIRLYNESPGDCDCNEIINTLNLLYSSPEDLVTLLIQNEKHRQFDLDIWRQKPKPITEEASKCYLKKKATSLAKKGQH